MPIFLDCSNDNFLSPILSTYPYKRVQNKEFYIHFLAFFCYFSSKMFVFIISISFFNKVSTENGIRDRGLLVVLYVGKMSIQILVSLNRSNPVAFKQPGVF